jgi:adenylate cyclase
VGQRCGRHGAMLVTSNWAYSSDMADVADDLARYRAVGLEFPQGFSDEELGVIIRWLEDRGSTVDDVCSALRDPEIPGLIRSAIGTDRRPMSLRQISVETDVPIDIVREVRLAAGLEPVDDDAVVYESSDTSAFETLRLGLQMFSREEMMAFIRVVGSSMGRVADAAQSLFHGEVERHLIASGDPSSVLVRRTVEAQNLAMELSSVLHMMMRQHLDQSVQRARQAYMATSRADLMAPMVVGFVDLVGFTSRSVELDAESLADLVTRFEAMANDTITTLGGRLVKLIGDEVMFVAVAPEDGVRIADSLLREFGSTPDLTPRGGMAYGPVLARAGDYFGSNVNLAARLVDQAVPGEILLTDDLATLVTHPLQPAGRRMLKGFPDPITVSSLTV